MKKIIASIFLLGILSAEKGFAEDILNSSNPFMSQIQQTAQSYGDPVVDRLASYKRGVEKTAYETTLKLCEGYRRAKYLGPHPYHGKWMYSFNQSMNAWTKVAKEGALQPLSAIGGLKADYLSLQNIGFFDFESWFGSMYTFYLVNSLGFLSGAMHCLDTMDQSEINYFAATIVIVDYEMSLAAHTGVTIAAGQVFSMIAKATRFVWRPVGKLIGVATTRISPTPLKVMGLSLGGVIADNLMVYIGERQQSLELIQSIVSGDSQLNEDLRFRNRFVLLNRAYEIALEQSQVEKQLRASGQVINEEEVYKPLYDFLRANLGPERIQQMDSDLEELQSRSHIQKNEVVYQKLLEAFLPVVKEVIAQRL